jgi:AraC-like DNA-binding protein
MMNGSAPEDGIGIASRLLFSTGGRARIASVTKRTGLSARHFQRRFTAQIGLSPKLYARTIRFDAALSAHRRDPTRTWTEIAHEAGYFDQAHFVRECHALVQAAPSQFIDRITEVGGIIGIDDARSPVVRTVASFVAHNLPYRLHYPTRRLVLCQKLAPTLREWSHFRPFRSSSRADWDVDDDWPDSAAVPNATFGEAV